MSENARLNPEGSASPPIRMIAVWAAVTAWAALTGYFLIFSQFAPYDDEGYLMITFRNFLDGWPLYDQIYTQYGPTPYLYKWLVHSFSGLPVTHEVTRLTSLTVWIATSLLSSIAVWRISRSFLTTGLSYALVFLSLSRLTFEPGHPQDLCGLLVAVIVLAATFTYLPTLKHPALVTIGLALALLLLTKLNLGIFVGSALAFCLLRFGKRNWGSNAGLIVVSVGMAALPVILLRDYFGFGWFGFSVIVWSGLFSTLLVLNDRNEAAFLSFRDQLCFATSFLAGVLGVLLFAIVGGTSISALLDGVLLQNFRFSAVAYLPAPTHVLSPYWSALSLAAAIAYKWSLARSAHLENGLAILKLLYGLAVCSAAVVAFFSPGHLHLVLSFATPFVWLVLVGRGNDHPFARTLLVLGSLMLALQIFPIPGSQMAFAGHLTLICGLIALSDGLRNLEKLPAPGRLFGETVIAGVACVALATASYSVVNRFTANDLLELYGSGSMRLPSETAHDLRAISSKVRERCSLLFSMPGMYSFNFWTRLETPTKGNGTGWMALLPEPKQQEILAALDAAEKPCVIYQPRLANGVLRTGQLTDIPLARYILENFSETRRYGEYILLENKKVLDNR